MEDPGLSHEELVAARLSLRRPTPSDIDIILSIHCDRRTCEYNPSDLLTTRSEAEDLYRRWDDHWQRHGFGYWVIRPRESGEPLGFCGLKVMRLRGREVLNLFYRLAPSAWGNGVATEAATAVVGWAATHRPQHLVVARVRPENRASAQVAERAGLTRAAHLDTDGEDGLDWVFTTADAGTSRD